MGAHRKTGHGNAARPDGKMGAEHKHDETLTTPQNKVLKKVANKKRRQRDKS